MDNIKDDRLHKILEFIIKGRTDKQIMHDWTFEDLANELRMTDKHEVDALCRELARHSIVHLMYDSGFTINETNLRFAKAAYSSKKFKEKADFWRIPINISSIAGSIATVAAAVLGVIAFQQGQTVTRQGTELKELKLQTSKIVSIYLYRVSFSGHIEKMELR